MTKVTYPPQPHTAPTCNPTTQATSHPRRSTPILVRFLYAVPSQAPKHPSTQTPCNTGSLHVPPIDPVDNKPKMSEPSTPLYIHAGSVLTPTHQRTTSRCENVLRQVLAKDADRLARRPIASTEHTRQNNESVKHWLAHTGFSLESRDALSSGSSLSRSQSVSSKPTYLSSQLVGTTRSVTPFILNFDPLSYFSPIFQPVWHPFG